MNGTATSTPTAWPSRPTRRASCCVVSPKPQPMSSTESPGCGGCILIATLPNSASPRTIRSRYSTKRSKRTPLHASVASSFSAATPPVLGTVIFSTYPDGSCDPRRERGETCRFDQLPFVVRERAKHPHRRNAMPEHKVGTQEEWQAARDELLKEEKELTRKG